MIRPPHIQRGAATVGTAFVLTAFIALAGEEPKKHGTDILHFSIQERMVNGGALADASGKVDVHWNKEGKSNHQEVRLHLKGLQAGATYQLGALVNDDSNLTQVVTFTPDKEGKADIQLREKGPKHPKSKDGHVNQQLPAELQPITLIHQLIVSDTNDTNGAVVLSADLTTP